MTRLKLDVDYNGPIPHRSVRHFSAWPLWIYELLKEEIIKMIDTRGKSLSAVRSVSLVRIRHEGIVIASELEICATRSMCSTIWLLSCPSSFSIHHTSSRQCIGERKDLFPIEAIKINTVQIDV